MPSEPRRCGKHKDILAAAAFAPGARETAEASLIDWHETLGHPHPASVLFLEQRGLIRITGQKTLDDFNCRIYKEAKSTVPHYQRGTRSIKIPGEIVHVDLVGPFEPDMNGYKHMVVFIDEASRFKNVFGLKNKGDVHKILKIYIRGMQTSGVNVNCIRGDGAGELGRSKIFRQELRNLGLQWESSPPYTHQQQGLVERAIRHVMEGGRAQLARSYLGNGFWFYACQDFTFKSNCLPHQTLGGDTPHERLHPGRKPRYQAFRKFGQTVYVHIDKTRQGEFSRGKRNKMRPRSERGTLIGHAMGASAYLVHLERLNKVVTLSAVVFNDIRTEIPFMAGRPEHWTSPGPGIDDAAPIIEEETAIEERDGNLAQTQQSHSVFDGRDIPRPQRISRATESRVKIEETGNEQNEEVRTNSRQAPEQVGNTGSVLRRSTRNRIQFDPQSMPSGTSEMNKLTQLIDEDSDEEENNFAQCMLADTSITVQEALAGPEASKWKEAIEAENRGLEKMKVLIQEDCSAGIKPLKSIYVLSKKKEPDGVGERYKARRVVQGFHQVYGRDFLETFRTCSGF